jgi:hypothetical protein
LPRLFRETRLGIERTEVDSGRVKEMRDYGHCRCQFP